MSCRTRWMVHLGIALAGLPMPVAGQSLYAGAGGGLTAVTGPLGGGRSTYRQFYGMIGIESASSLGVRLEGAESFGFAWLSADFTYSVGGPSVRGYGLAGGGLRVAVFDSDPIATVGAGTRFAVGRAGFLFAEARLQRVLGLGPGEPRTFIPLTLGVGVRTR